MRKLIAVCGSDVEDVHLSTLVLDIAERVGYLIARKGAALLCGGGGGVMEAACRGAKRAQGLTIGILPANVSYANPYLDIGLATHMGRARNYILIQSAQAVIGIAGRWGTLNEIALALNVGKPTIIIKGTGGWMDVLSGEKMRTFLNSLPATPLFASSPEEAVEMAFSAIK